MQTTASDRRSMQGHDPTRWPLPPGRHHHPLVLLDAMRMGSLYMPDVDSCLNSCIGRGRITIISLVPWRLHSTTTPEYMGDETNGWLNSVLSLLLMPAAELYGVTVTGDSVISSRVIPQQYTRLSLNKP